MGDRRLKWLAWGIACSAVLLVAVSIVFVYLNRGAQFAYWGSGVGFGVAYPIIGAFIVSRLPRHRMGWLLCASALWSLESFAGAYGAFAVAEQPTLPLGIWLAWLCRWLWMPAALLVVYIALLFPTGHFVSDRWKFAIWFGTLGIILNSTSVALFPGQPPSSGIGFFFNNPISLVGAEAFLEVTRNVGGVLFAGISLVSVVGFILRLRRAVGHERQQLKWFAFACAVSFPLLVLGNVINAFLQTIYGGAGIIFGTVVLGTIVSALMPLAAGIAILKYRLYDIDLIIRRTLIYGVLTALLAIVYFGSVIILQQLFRGITDASQSELVTIISTLAIAALFTPLRHRVQDVIDRRFYRRKYDAAKVLADFSLASRDEVELEKLTSALLNVVQDTMQPVGVGLWLKQADEHSRPTKGK